MKELGKYPIDALLAEIAQSVQDAGTVLIKAEPGAGKTTRVPLHLLDSINGHILVLEPRRLAARLSAHRCAWFLDEACGLRVGYRIRQESKVSPKTRLTFITEGLFLRLLRGNSSQGKGHNGKGQDKRVSQKEFCTPGAKAGAAWAGSASLAGVGAVVLDEFHERNIHTDIALALVRRLQQTVRKDLKLVVMSATLDTGALEKYLADAAVFDVKGKIFPVDIEFISQLEASRQKSHDRGNRLVEAVTRMMKDPRCPGNILVFLTGMGEIMQAKRDLERVVIGDEAEILPLAADLSVREQQRVFLETGKRKIVLSTNVAETSLTIPGITGVIDTGLAKIPAHAPWSGMPTLEIKRISRASAVQRGGRAGRTRSGLVVRLYSRPEFLTREAFTPPDIRRIDISHTLLEVMNLGYQPDLMPWFEPPEDKNLESAGRLLVMLGAVTEGGDLTPFGEALSRLPFHPRLAAVAIEGRARGNEADALLAACTISEGFSLKRDAISPGEDEEGEPCDLSVQLDLIKSALYRKDELSPYPLHFLDSRRQKRILSLYGSMARICKLPAKPPAARTDPGKLIHCLLRGYPDRVARRREISRKKVRKGVSALYNFCLGRGGMVGKGSLVFNRKPDFLIAVDAVESLKSDASKGIMIRACAALPIEVLKQDPGGMLREERREEFEPKDGKLTVMQDLFYGNLKVESKRVGTLEGEAGFARALEENWPYPFENDNQLTIYHHRVALLDAYNIPHNCPVFSGEMRMLFFECICEGISSLKE
ncbi:MAG: ATP-dependent RNA helicase, partial [bacterium]|nr:ATP-dependent RNA helicase [bacterium]